MGRVIHQKSNKQAGSSNDVRASKTSKQRRKHKVVIESDSQDKEKSRAVLSFRADPPPGYTFIPAGNPQLTAALKEFAKKGNHQILAVTTTPHASRHELSREVHRIGFHFPTEVVAQVCNHYGIRLTSGGKLVEEKDDDKLFMRLYQKGQLVLDEKVRDQVTINTEAKQIIQDLFPNIPDDDLFRIIKTAFQLGDGKVGTADEIPLVRRAQLSVVAHIRHTYTGYDKLLRQVPYSEARHQVENITLQKLIDWRGDNQDDKQVMDDTLREVVVISDEEDSDDLEEGQLVENEHLVVQPFNSNLRSKNIEDGRPRSPIEIHSDEEAPQGYKYLPQAVRRLPLHDPTAVSVARQQSRYAVWDRVREEYRGGVVPQATRVLERIPVDEPPMLASQSAYGLREPIYVSESVPRRAVEQTGRVVSQPSPSTYVRGADGKLYERITTYSEQAHAPVPLRRAYTPPVEYSRQYLDSRPASPRSQLLAPHRRTASFENNDGTVLPSIEGPNGIHASPAARRNPFEETRLPTDHRNSGAFDANRRQSHIIDLTSSAEQASKRRRIEEAPPSPYLVRQLERSQMDYERNGPRVEAHQQYAENTQRSHQQRSHPLDNSMLGNSSQRSYDGSEQRMQPTVIYREEVNRHETPSPRFAGARQILPLGASDTYYPSRRVEYVSDYDQPPAQLLDEPVRQRIPSRAELVGEYQPRPMPEQLPSYGQPSYRVEPITRYVRSEVRNPFEASTYAPHYVQDVPQDRTQREYTSSVARQYLPPRDVRAAQLPESDGLYQQARMAPPPTTVYRDGQNIRTTYVQN